MPDKAAEAAAVENQTENAVSDMGDMDENVKNGAIVNKTDDADPASAGGVVRSSDQSDAMHSEHESATSLSSQSAASLMPQDSLSRRILQERARVLAMPAVQQQHQLRSQYLKFRLGQVERYGIPYRYLEELLYVGNLARVPCTPAFVAGVINHRGALLTILDLKQFFRMPALAPTADTRIIVVRHAGMRVGLLVDDVDGNQEYLEAELAPPLISDGVSNIAYVQGIHRGDVTLLNLAALLEDPALQVNR